MSRKVKLSVTVDRDLAQQVEQQAAGRSRSAIVREALELWLRSDRRASLDRAVEAYYAQRPKEEEEEDAEWAALATGAAAEVW